MRSDSINRQNVFASRTLICMQEFHVRKRLAQIPRPVGPHHYPERSPRHGSGGRQLAGHTRREPGKKIGLGLIVISSNELNVVCLYASADVLRNKVTY